MSAQRELKRVTGRLRSSLLACPAPDRVAPDVIQIMKPDLVAIGLRAKTARAIVVVLGGPPDSPSILLKGEISLTDPKLLATAQPYHQVMDLPWDESERAVRKYVTSIERVATRALDELIQKMAKSNHKVAAVGILGAPDRDLKRIGNSHIRAHAAEGVLFRRVLAVGAEANGLRCQTFSDRNFDQAAAVQLGAKYSRIKRSLNGLKTSVLPPWRNDEKQAAMAAWLMLHP